MTSSGFVLNNKEQIMEFTHTDLPEPVAPAINKCGIRFNSPYTLSPVKSFPKQNSSFLLSNSLGIDCINSFICTGVFSTFGISIPTALFPGIGASIRRSVAANAILISFAKLLILLTRTPSSGLISNLVTLGPI